MRSDRMLLLARHVLANTRKNKAMLVLPGLIIVLLLYAAWSGIAIYKQQTASRVHYQQQVRTNWEKMPDKHPHRMAHYGYIVFRPKHLLSIFDFGMESYTGNAIFLEAHRQNTTNLSEAGFSTGMLRFGEISMGMVLQLLVPLVIFFIGFNAIAADRENGTLKILLSQGASWMEILTGKALGLMCIAWPLLWLAILLVGLGVWWMPAYTFTRDDAWRMAMLFVSYTLYFALVCMVTVIISAVSSTSKLALVSLIGIWLLGAIVLPRTIQAIGNMVYAAPSKIAFEAAIEKDLIKKGDSHDPNDPHYKALKDSVLKANHVDSVQQLPFNYSGFQMKEGERISAEIFNVHHHRLMDIYRQQNKVTQLAGFINPFAALRNLSMAFSGTDFHAYTAFQQQAETYRYKLAQHMNNLQIELISNKKPGAHEPPLHISHDHWKAFPDFQYHSSSTAGILTQEILSIGALLWWAVLLVSGILLLSKQLKAI